ncbi:hypothetical protein DPEC_G00232250 [Dallia pectoralis]|uniref:Uncharacterized protein n=1 Tax=Dallia pectoralis TaxID=75939 RepID=A0ACC2FXF7_DALPE|nr:hypothetical protein DPEC_G00232250 [Dallia pectoralis]
MAMVRLASPVTTGGTGHHREPHVIYHTAIWCYKAELQVWHADTVFQTPSVQCVSPQPAPEARGPHGGDWPGCPTGVGIPVKELAAGGGWGLGCAHPGVYSSVEQLLNWIYTVMEKNS